MVILIKPCTLLYHLWVRNAVKSQVLADISINPQTLYIVFIHEKITLVYIFTI